MVIVDILSPPSDFIRYDIFENRFLKNKELPNEIRNNYWVSFKNLKEDAILVCPVPYYIDDDNKKMPYFSDNDKKILKYLDLFHFFNEAPITQQHNLWKGVARKLLEEIDKDSEPRWLSTHGLGVRYLHVRIDTKPKYYSHKEYKNPSFYYKNGNSQSQKSQLQQEINNLENKPNRTPAEQQELNDKKEQLTKLTQQQNKDGLPWGKIGLGVLGVSLVVLVIVLIVKKSKK